MPPVARRQNTSAGIAIAAAAGVLPIVNLLRQRRAI
jgi:hypothetical protein